MNCGPCDRMGPALPVTAFADTGDDADGRVTRQPLGALVTARSRCHAI
jgi:hypothetical protein